MSVLFLLKTSPEKTTIITWINSKHWFWIPFNFTEELLKYIAMCFEVYCVMIWCTYTVWNNYQGQVISEWVGVEKAEDLLWATVRCTAQPCEPVTELYQSPSELTLFLQLKVHVLWPPLLHFPSLQLRETSIQLLEVSFSPLKFYM